MNSLKEQDRLSKDEGNLTSKLKVTVTSLTMHSGSIRSFLWASQEGGTVRLTEDRDGVPSMKQSPQSPILSGYQMLEPVQMSRMARSLRSLETEFVESYFKVKRQLHELRPIYNQLEEFSRAYSMTYEGQTHAIVTFGSVEHEILPRLDELKQELRQLESNLLECRFKMTNEDDCSHIWTRLEDLKDQTLSVEDALGDFGSSIGEMRRWSHKFHIPACADFHSRADDLQSHSDDKPKITDIDAIPNPPIIDLEAVPDPHIIDVEAIADSPATLLQAVVNNNATIQFCISFYQACVASIRDSVEGFLRAIPAGTFSIDQLVIWGRLTYFSLDDISQGLASFPKIVQRMDSAVC